MSLEDRRMRIPLHLSEILHLVQKQTEYCAEKLSLPLLIGAMETTHAYLFYIKVSVRLMML